MKQIYFNTQIQMGTINEKALWWCTTEKVPHLFQIKAYGTCNGIFIQDLSEN